MNYFLRNLLKKRIFKFGLEEIIYIDSKKKAEIKWNELKKV